MSPNLPPFYHDVHKRVTYYCIAISFIYCFFTCWYHNNLFIFFQIIRTATWAATYICSSITMYLSFFLQLKFIRCRAKRVGTSPVWSTSPAGQAAAAWFRASLPSASPACHPRLQPQKLLTHRLSSQVWLVSNA